MTDLERLERIESLESLIRDVRRQINKREDILNQALTDLAELKKQVEPNQKAA